MDNEIQSVTVKNYICIITYMCEAFLLIKPVLHMKHLLQMTLSFIKHIKYFLLLLSKEMKLKIKCAYTLLLIGQIF